MKAAEFDRIFDEGEEDIIEYLDLSKARRPGLEQQNTKVGYYSVVTRNSTAIVRITKYKGSRKRASRIN